MARVGKRGPQAVVRSVESHSAAGRHRRHVDHRQSSWESVLPSRFPLPDMPEHCDLSSPSCTTIFSGRVEGQLYRAAATRLVERIDAPTVTGFVLRVVRTLAGNRTRPFETRRWTFSGICPHRETKRAVDGAARTSPSVYSGNRFGHSERRRVGDGRLAERSGQKCTGSCEEPSMQGRSVLLHCERYEEIHNREPAASSGGRYA